MAYQQLKRHILIGLIVLAISLTAFANPAPAIDGPAVVAGSPAVAAADGRELTAADWVAHLPLAGAMVILVLTVNGLFIAQIVRRRHGKRGG